jgi:hypothetical protein
MGDAEIIPIGTRGRPGRGQGSGRPSAASRSLAAGPRKSAPTKSRAADLAAEPGAAESAEPSAADDTADDTRGPAHTEERLPSGGIPAGDWLSAFQQASRDLFGDK